MAPTPPLQRFLTGITTSGTPHLGNYVGSIRPSVAASRQPGVESFYFLADYHALIKCDDPQRVQRSTLEIAASWLAAGLDPERVTFYRQSDVPEIPELCWLLTCIAPKGLLNRAHAYKAAVDRNAAAGTDPDADVTAGLFLYPVLMAADIILFNAHKVPVGRDQVQHLEMARDIAARFNHLYRPLFVLPEVVVDDHVATLPGLDGRKMSKSYDNTIALFAPQAQLRRQIAGIVTDSRAPGEPKDTADSALFQIYQAFATAEETAALRRAYADGIAWGEAKQMLFERIDRDVAPLRDRYQALVAEPQRIEDILRAGAAKARAHAMPLMAQVRDAVGLRPLGQAGPASKTEDGKRAAPASADALPLPSFKQYREADGRFYFKMAAPGGAVLLQSRSFDSPRDAAQVIQALQREGRAARDRQPEVFEPLPSDSAGPDAARAHADAVDAALDRLRQAQAPLD